jgi:hypothetical protein
MTAFLIIVIVLLGIALTEIKLRKFSDKEKKNLPYFKKKNILNEKEQVLFHRLIEAMPNCFVLAQVRLADIVGVRKGKNWQIFFNKISSKSVDYVICDKSFGVLACIELDGKTHNQKDRQKADGNKDSALNAAGIPIIRIEASKLNSTEEIKKILENAVLHLKTPLA